MDFDLGKFLNYLKLIIIFVESLHMGNKIPTHSPPPSIYLMLGSVVGILLAYSLSMLDCHASCSATMVGKNFSLKKFLDYSLVYKDHYRFFQFTKYLTRVKLVLFLFS